MAAHVTAHVTAHVAAHVAAQVAAQVALLVVALVVTLITERKTPTDCQKTWRIRDNSKLIVAVARDKRMAATIQQKAKSAKGWKRGMTATLLARLPVEGTAATAVG